MGSFELCEFEFLQFQFRIHIYGWEVYKSITDAESNNLAIDASSNVDEISSKIEKKLTKAKHKAFGKCSSGQQVVDKKISNLLRERGIMKSDREKAEIDNEIGKELTKEKYESVEKQVRSIKEKYNSHSSQVFHLRKMITNRGDKSPIEAIIHPESKELIYDKDEILHETLKYASCVLQNNNPVGEYKDLFDAMKIRHKMRMNKKGENEDEALSEEDFRNELKLLKEKGKNKYKEITEAGLGFKKDVFRFMKLIWDSEEIPATWNLTTLVQIFKKGNRNSLESYRYVQDA